LGWEDESGGLAELRTPCYQSSEGGLHKNGVNYRKNARVMGWWIFRGHWSVMLLGGIFQVGIRGWYNWIAKTKRKTDPKVAT